MCQIHHQQLVRTIWNFRETKTTTTKLTKNSLLIAILRALYPSSGFHHYNPQVVPRPIQSCAKYLGKNFFPNLLFSLIKMVLVQDLLHPNPASEAQKYKLKTLVQAPRSFFMDVKCPGCLNITTVFSHAQTAVTCDGCATVLCQPTGGKAKLTEGCSFRRK